MVNRNWETTSLLLNTCSSGDSEDTYRYTGSSLASLLGECMVHRCLVRVIQVYD